MDDNVKDEMSSKKIQKLLTDNNHLNELQIERINKNTSLVKKIAYHLLGKLPPTVLLEDLIQAGMLGLLEASKQYDDTKGAAFETYASIRIRGHMLDEVRRNDWVPRSVHKNSRIISEAVRRLENRLGRDAKDHEIALELKIPLNDYYAMLSDTVGCHLYGFEELGVTDDNLQNNQTSREVNEPHRHIQEADIKSLLTKIINNLPLNERLVLSLYYERDLNLKEIGDVLGVSESRVSQIHSQATHRVKARLQKQYP